MSPRLQLKVSIVTVFSFFLSSECICQPPEIADSTKTFSYKKRSLGIELTASTLPKATIISTGGSYKIKSLLQSSYDLGLNYNRTIKKDLDITAGIHFVVGKWNFYMNVPPEDLGPSYSDGRRIIELKELWGAFRFPLQVRKRIGKTKSGFLQGGMSFRYSGLMIDLGVGGSLSDSNNNQTRLFDANFRLNNQYKPWITFLAGAGKALSLKNHNMILACLQADISRSYFLRGDYQISIPNKPISTGLYKINGSSLGLSVQYIFTGANKQMVITSQKRKKHVARTNPVQINRKTILDNYIFKGNHIQFSFAPLTTLKAKLKALSGDYPLSTSATPGLLLSLKYSVNFNNAYSLKTGPEAMLLGRNFITYFSKNDFSPPLTADFNTRGVRSLLHILTLSLPVTT